MSVSTILHAVGTAARDFAGHASSTPPKSYFPPSLAIPHADEDPWDDIPEHEMQRVRLRLIEDTARRQQRAERGLRTGSRAELRRLGLVEVVA